MVLQADQALLQAPKQTPPLTGYLKTARGMDVKTGMPLQTRDFVVFFHLMTDKGDQAVAIKVVMVAEIVGGSGIAAVTAGIDRKVLAVVAVAAAKLQWNCPPDPTPF